MLTKPACLLVTLYMLSASSAIADHIGAFRVQFVNPGFAESGFWHSVTNAMLSAAYQLGIEVSVSYGDREWPKMRDNALAAIQQPDRADYLILVNEHQQAADLVELASRRNIPTFLLLNTLTAEQEADVGRARQELASWLGSLTPDNKQAGYEMALSVIDTARQLKPDQDKLGLIALAGDFATPASIERMKGLDLALSEHPNVVEHRRLTVNWSFDEAYQRINAWLNSGHDFDAVWAANDPIALGAISAASQHGLVAGQDYAIAGLNWSAPALETVHNGQMTLTHGGHFLAGAWAMVLLYDHHHGFDYGTAEPHLRFPMSAIDASAPEALLDVLTTEQWSRIDFRAFSRALNPHLTDYDFSIEALDQAIVTRAN